MLPKYYEFINSVKIISGENALENLSYELNILKCSKPLMVTDAVLEKLGTLKIVQKAMKGIDTDEIFTDIPIDSSISTIEKMKKIYLSSGCDGIVAVGGGSVIDTAKGLKMLLSQGEAKLKTLMGNEILTKGKYIPFVVVPTTSGTGSECTQVAVISNPEDKRKMEFISSQLLPDVTVLDVRMTINLPQKLTITTAIDALCHSIEAFSCNQKNPLSDAYAISAIKLISEYLVPTVVDGNYKEGRIALANAALMAGVSFSNSMVGLCHAIAHALGGVAKVAHGDAITILLPYVMEYNLDMCDKEYSDLLLYLTDDEIYVRTFKDERAGATISAIKNLYSRLAKICPIPTKLSDKGVREYQLNEIANKALEDGALILNKKRARKEDILEILKKAY